jgi:FkbM family methyltransferase
MREGERVIRVLKSLGRRTFLYGMLQRARIRKSVREWTAHDDAMARFYSQFVSPGRICFDVGANVGNRVKVFLKLGAKVVAVEPQSQCQKLLRSIFTGNPGFTLVPKAMGAAEGQAEIAIADVSTVSSMSQEWLEKVKSSGRFGEVVWSKKQMVPVTTLDKLIDAHGVPDFIKIDVEGYEYPVIQGLSKPVKALSLEFTPEFLDSTLKCIDHLSGLGDIRVNYSLGESMEFASPEWLAVPDAVRALEGFRDRQVVFGDVYVRFV